MGQAKRTAHRIKYLKDYYIQNRSHELTRSSNRRKDNLKWVNEIKSELPCIKCGETDIRCLDFHHRNPDSKILAVASMIRHSRKKILEEIKKCDVLCANCHRKERTEGV